MFKKILISLVISLSFLSCEQPTNDFIKEVTTINNIPIIWKGSLSSAPPNPEIGWAYYNIIPESVQKITKDCNMRPFIPKIELSPS
jgi:hypothetical protein